MTTDQFLLKWLAKEDSSALGECKGEALNLLISRGDAEIHNPDQGDYARVVLTDLGQAKAKALIELEASEPKPKTINRDTYLRGLALAAMANGHAMKAREFELELVRLLGYEDYAGHVSDVIYEEHILTIERWNASLRMQEILVEGEPPA